jgi:hypothetical protein
MENSKALSGFRSRIYKIDKSLVNVKGAGASGDGNWLGKL